MNTTTQPAVYVGTYHKYNCGSIAGAWLTLTDYDDETEFLAACPAVPCALSPFKPLSPGLRQAQPVSSVQGKWHAVNRAPDSRHCPCWFAPLRRRFSNG